ncbi:MAG: replication-associated recombination protein A [Clostridiales bacterium]|jgi:putative ATPase|nr:replication-associated recombination protein A [Clostridiales bacterium]
MNDPGAPLASRLRPETLEEYVGQRHLLGEGKVLRRLIERDKICSMILWGPPGVGKTTLARVIARQTLSGFVNFSATASGIKEIKDVMASAERRRVFGESTIVFVDEIHRFNKSQQDAFLPYVENGGIILIGATTENPSFEVNSALLSRCKVFVLQPLAEEELAAVGRRALASGFDAPQPEMPEDLLKIVARFANGDARILLNTLEMIVVNSENGRITEELVSQCVNRKLLLYDKRGEEHYNLISALHKSMRNSDVNAAIYWLARMLEGGEDPLYVARRIVRFASEDIGMADSKALEISVAAYQACHFIGMPECGVHLTHAVVYCALAPKSNRLYEAYKAAKADALETLAEPVPLVIRNAVTSLMKNLRYGAGYQYAHDTEEKLTNMRCLPDALAGREYYHPAEQGLEVRVKERMDKIKAWQAEHQS